MDWKTKHDELMDDFKAVQGDRDRYCMLAKNMKVLAQGYKVLADGYKADLEGVKAERDALRGKLERVRNQLGSYLHGMERRHVEDQWHEAQFDAALADVKPDPAPDCDGTRQREGGPDGPCLHAPAPTPSWENRDRVNYSTESLEKDFDKCMGQTALEALAAISRGREAERLDDSPTSTKQLALELPPPESMHGAADGFPGSDYALSSENIATACTTCCGSGSVMAGHNSGDSVECGDCPTAKPPKAVLDALQTEAIARRHNGWLPPDEVEQREYEAEHIGAIDALKDVCAYHKFTVLPEHQRLGGSPSAPFKRAITAGIDQRVAQAQEEERQFFMTALAKLELERQKLAEQLTRARDGALEEAALIVEDCGDGGLMWLAKDIRALTRNRRTDDE